MIERENSKQPNIFKICRISWYLFIPILFGVIMALRDNPSTFDYVTTLFVVIVINSIGNFILSLYSQYLEEQN